MNVAMVVAAIRGMMFMIFFGRKKFKFMFEFSETLA